MTGGTAGIGRAAALTLARAGARVAVAGRGMGAGAEVVAQIRELGGDALFYACDVASADQVVALVAETVRAFGRLDCAFNNAGWEGSSFAPIADAPQEEFDRLIAVNLRGVWLCLKHEIHQMLRQAPPGGAIVNISSVSGLGGTPRAGGYAAAKAGVLALTKSAALEYAGRGIRVNAIVAGAFHTAMLERVWATLAGEPGATDAVAARYREMIPMGRIGRPEEAAEAVVWLCSDAASYVTGHSLMVDGGVAATLR